MRKLDTTLPQPGLCSFQQLPDPYRFAFQQGSAHHLPGQFLPAEVDWFSQIFMLPFWLIYALPPLIMLPALLSEVVLQSEGYTRFLQAISRQSLGENALTLGLFVLCGGLLIYSAWFAWDGGSSFVRTWQAHRLQKCGDHGFGLVLLERGIIARLIDNIDGRNCIWLPREAIADILWHRGREEGAKHSRWVYRTQLCYITEHRGKPQKRWIKLKGSMVKTGIPIENSSVRDSRGDRFLFEQLDHWWRNSA
ncbi:MAG: hypothetical protein AAF685_09540 [Cyanobacteria bacterium P01_C01_bin.89]